MRVGTVFVLAVVFLLAGSQCGCVSNARYAMVEYERRELEVELVKVKNAQQVLEQEKQTLLAWKEDYQKSDVGVMVSKAQTLEADLRGANENLRKGETENAALSQAVASEKKEGSACLEELARVMAANQRLQKSEELLRQILLKEGDLYWKGEIISVSEKGKYIQLYDGTVWEVDRYDHYTTSMWYSGVVLINFRRTKMINPKVGFTTMLNRLGEEAGVSQIR